MIGIYARHIVTCMTPAYRQMYISNMYTDKILLVTVSIIIWIVGALQLILGKVKSCGGKYYELLLAVIVPSILQVLGAPELRFFVLPYFVLYAYVFMYIDYKQLWIEIRTRWVTVLSVVLIIVVLWISVFGSIMAGNSQRVLLIDDNDLETSIE